jgi:hypothetical protein
LNQIPSFMCDFHSIVVRRDGVIAHIPSNSHSGAVKEAGWTENDQMAEMRDQMRFVEVEWSGQGDFPGAVQISRGTINDKQARVIESHYTALAKLLSAPEEHAERMLFDGGIFDGDQFADLRWKVLIHDKCPRRVADRLVKLRLHANGEHIKSIDPRIEKIDGNVVVAEDYEILAPALTEVGGYLRVYGSAKLDAPALTEVGGELYVYGSAKLDAPALTEVGGDLCVYGSAKLDAPALTEVGGYLCVYGSAKLDAPALKSVNGKAYSK